MFLIWVSWQIIFSRCVSAYFNLQIKARNILVRLISLLICCCLANTLQAQQLAATGIDTNWLSQNKNITTSNTKLAEKYYRQALFYYFQNQPQKTLEQLAYNKAQLTDYTYNAQLFTAGLQLSEGMHNQSKNTLQQLAYLLSDQISDKKTWLKVDDNRVAELEITSLQTLIQLQLAEHYIANGDITLGKKALEKIARISPQYSSQYNLLEQLAYWGEANHISKAPLNLIEEGITNSPYYLLNEAIRHINNKNFETASSILTYLQQFQWQPETKSFWQTLFTSSFSSFSAPKNNQLLNQSGNNNLTPELTSQLTQENEQAAIQQYATLLLAQVNVEQQSFENSYQLMKGFPQESAFNEQALFLFAYSAYKMENFSQSEMVLSLLINNHPYSPYSYQALQLQAQQYLELKNNNKALNQYLFIENSYLKQIKAFNDFSQEINEKSDLLSISQHQPPSGKPLPNNTHQLTKIVLSQTDIAYKLAQIADVKQLEQRLISKQLHVKRLADIIAINKVRQQKISQENSVGDFQFTLAKLNQTKEVLSRLLNEAEQLKKGEVFADVQQQQWLTRINNAKTVIKNIAPHKNINSYQERLNRVNGVLSWQLTQQYSERFWQHKTLLKQLTEKLNATAQQANNIDSLLIQDSSLNIFHTRQQIISKKVQKLLAQNKSLEESLQVEAKTLILQFVNQQQKMLKQNLLVSRRAMAKVIEKMNVGDEVR